MSRPLSNTAIFVIFSWAAALAAQSAAPAQHAPASAGKPVARVNGAVLTDHDLAREMKAMFPYAQQHGGEIPKAMESQIRAGAMEMIVFEELVYQDALRRKLTVQPARMQRAQAEFHKQFKSPEDYNRFFQSEAQGSEQVLLAKLRRALLIEDLLNVEVTSKAVVSPAELKAYYDKNPNLFRVPETYSLQTISIVPPANPAQPQREEARRRAESALKQEQATQNYQQFGLLAEKISEDDYRVMMGDHKQVDAAKLPPAIALAIRGMKAGQVSGLIQVDPVYTIVRLNAHAPAGVQSFESVKTALRQKMEKEKTEHLRSSWYKQLRSAAKVEVL
jgi:peptidyl-prolyl cis-trans isomerase C